MFPSGSRRRGPVKRNTVLVDPAISSQLHSAKHLKNRDKRNSKVERTDAIEDFVSIISRTCMLVAPCAIVLLMYHFSLWNGIHD